MDCEDNGIIERLQKDLEKHKNDLQTWTDSLEELSEIEDALDPDEKSKLEGRTILDVGTDCVKPLYIAIKLNPKKIVGINEELLYSYTSDIEQKSKLFVKTKIRFYNCSFFDKQTIDRIIKREGMLNKSFDFILVSKTLHHLRTANCVAKERDEDDEEHKCSKTEKCCIYGFEEQVIFQKLLGLGKRVIIYEFFDPNIPDDDKIRGRGGYFIREEWERIFKHLSQENYNVKFIRPEGFQLNERTLNNAFSILRQVDTICFYVEKQDVENSKRL